MNAFRCITVLTLAGLLAACTSSAEQVAQRQSERCAARGLQPNTDAFNECIAALGNERDQRMESRRRDMMERSNVPPAASR